MHYYKNFIHNIYKINDKIYLNYGRKKRKEKTKRKKQIQLTEQVNIFILQPIQSLTQLPKECLLQVVLTMVIMQNQKS